VPKVKFQAKALDKIPDEAEEESEEGDWDDGDEF
jgi:hypothetical protein